MSKSLPIIVQIIVYRIKRGGPEFLLLKRTRERGGFWNVVNGTLELNESIIEARNRELLEETGIENVLHWSNEINRFSFQYKSDTMVVLVYDAEVNESQKIVINHEHTEYRWVNFEEAMNMLKFDDDKNGLRNCQKELMDKKV
jgi:dATP pyrophosphohydrolase